MRELKLAAIGSSAYIAEEVKGILTGLLGDFLPISARRLEKIETAEEDTLYICATTQGEKLCARVDAARVFILDLEPTTDFYLSISRIPAGSVVYIFNNLFPYTRLLIQRCHEMGLTHVSFVPLAYEEMAEAELIAELRRARYIIGVEALVGENVLTSRYKDALADGVRIISSPSTGSVRATNKLLYAIADFYEKAFAEALKADRSETVAARLAAAVESLQRAALRSVTMQLEVAAPGGEKSPGLSPSLGIEEEMELLCVLKGKIKKLSR